MGSEHLNPDAGVKGPPYLQSPSHNREVEGRKAKSERNSGVHALPWEAAAVLALKSVIGKDWQKSLQRSLYSCVAVYSVNSSTCKPLS